MSQVAQAICAFMCANPPGALAMIAQEYLLKGQGGNVWAQREEEIRRSPLGGPL